MASTLQTQPKGVLAMLESPAIAASLQNHVAKNIKVSTFIAFALNFARRNPSLLNCDKASVLLCLQRIGELGLLPDGRDAYLIPFKAECQLIISYHGLKKLVMRTGDVARIHAANIHENDSFAHNLGRITSHTWDVREDRGEIIASYCLIDFKDGQQASEIMSIDEIKAMRERSRAKGSGPWVTDFAMMCRKTVTRRLCNQSQWGIDIPEDDDDSSVSSIATPSRVNSMSRPPAPELDDSMEIEAVASPTKTPATALSKPVDMPEPATPMKSLAAIRSRLIKEGIPEQDFAGYLCANDLAGLPTDELAGIAVDMDKHVEEYRRPPAE